MRCDVLSSHTEDRLRIIFKQNRHRKAQNGEGCSEIRAPTALQIYTASSNAMSLLKGRRGPTEQNLLLTLLVLPVQTAPLTSESQIHAFLLICFRFLNSPT